MGSKVETGINMLPLFNIRKIQRRLSSSVRTAQLKTVAKRLARVPRVARTFTLEDFLSPKPKIQIDTSVWYVQSLEIRFEELKPGENNVFIDTFDPDEYVYQEMDARAAYEYELDSFNLRAWFLEEIRDETKPDSSAYALVTKLFPAIEENTRLTPLDRYNEMESYRERVMFDFNGDPLYEDVDRINPTRFIDEINASLNNLFMDGKIESYSKITHKMETLGVLGSGIKGTVLVYTFSIVLLFSNYPIRLIFDYKFFKPDPIEVES